MSTNLLKIALFAIAMLAGVSTAMTVTVAADDITPLFRLTAVRNAIDGQPIEGIDDFETPVEAGEGVFPLELTLKAGSQKTPAPVVTGISITFPEGICPEDQSFLVELWGVFDLGDNSFERMAYKGYPDSCNVMATITPFATKHLVLRLFANVTSAGAVPGISIYGSGDATPYSRRYAPADGEYAYSIIHKYKVFGQKNITVTTSDSGTDFILEVNTMQQIISKNFDETMDNGREEPEIEDIAISQKCTASIDSDMVLKNMSCADKYNGEETASVKADRPGNTIRITSKDETGILGDKSNNKLIFFNDMPVPIIMKAGLVTGNTIEAFSVNSNDAGKHIKKYISVMDHLEATDDRPEIFIIATHYEESTIDDIYLIDNNGLILLGCFHEGSYELRLEDDPSSIEITPLVTDLILQKKMHMETYDKYLRVPGLVKTATIKFIWNHIPPERFNFSSARQRLVAITETSPAHYEATVETTRFLPGESPLSDEPPLTDADIQSYISASEGLSIDNSIIRQIAEEITGSETDHLAIAIKIHNYVATNMYPSNSDYYFVEPATVIATRKKGDCKQHASLFAAIARAAGIPTRFTLGLRYLGGGYGHHVWNQVYYNGNWIDFDATDMAIIPGATHIQKFTTRSFNQFALNGSLGGLYEDPEITEYAESDTLTLDPITKTDAAITCPVYSDPLLGFEIDCPQGFIMDVSDFGVMRRVDFRSEEFPELILSVISARCPSRKCSFEDAFDSLPSNIFMRLFDVFGTIKKVKVDPRHISGGNSADIVAGEFRDRNNRFIHFEFIMAYGEKSVYITFLSLPAATYERTPNRINKLKSIMRVTR